MSIARHHSEWLSLIELSGPFLSMPVLMRVFPQGLDAHDPERTRTLRLAYDEWEDQSNKPAIHNAWIKFFLTGILNLPESSVLEGQAISPTLQVSVPEHGELLRPNLVIHDPNSKKDRLLVQTYPPSQNLDKRVEGKSWQATPGTRMMELLHATGIRLGIVTNGERWMLVDAPRNETTGFASWYANLWLEEPITLRAFTSLLGADRFFNAPAKDTLEAMLAESASNQQEVTDQLGYQVRRAVEVLIQSLDRADQDHDRHLLEGVDEKLLYEAALTVMMRLVFLFCAEERRLLPIDTELYVLHYAASTLREQLRKTADDHGEEILERRHDAWCRLLSTFRLVFGGCEHPNLRMPAYGGHLFDPDRFPFLEGRKKGTSWKNCEADPLPINNRTVLHLLEALQLLEVKMPGGEKAARRLSFRALDIEQIGHVYEGLLDHTAKRAGEPMLGLLGTRDREPEVRLSKLEELKAKGNDELIEFLGEESGKSAAALKKAIEEELDLTTANRFQAVIGSDQKLLKRIQPFGGLVREDTFGYPVIITKGSVFVTAGTDRRASGTHYTPKSLTEPIVQYTLEPLVYVGPAEGTPKAQWQLRGPKELLGLKICDMACGSGAFLVQACRYLSERVVESWEAAEKKLPKGTPGITPEGQPSTGSAGETLIPKDADERLAYAKRLVAQRCLYGVDINPLAAEMAKLSLWLLTLAKDRPFTFLDHAIRCGDSLLGIHDLKQLKTFSLDGTGQQYVFGEMPLDKMVDDAIELRLKIESMPSNNVEDVEVQAQLMADCEQRVEFLKCAADMLIAAELRGGNPREKLENRDHAVIQVGHYLKNGNRSELRAVATKAVGRRTFHWPVEFPEIVAKRGGFDAFVGNPPFMVAFKVAPTLGEDFGRWLKTRWAHERGRADLVAYFLLQASALLRKDGDAGLLTTKSISQEDNRKVALNHLIASGYVIYRARPDVQWPGIAAVHVAAIHFRRGTWRGECFVGDTPTKSIDSSLSAEESFGEPLELSDLIVQPSKGTTVNGEGFVLSEIEGLSIVKKSSSNDAVVKRFLNGDDLNSNPSALGPRYIIDFGEMDRSEASSFVEPWRIVVERVQTQRKNPRMQVHEKDFWKFSDKRPDLYQSLKGIRRAIAFSLVSKHFAFAFAPAEQVFSSSLGVLPTDDAAHLAVLQSSLHLCWAYNFMYSLETRPRYSIGKCFRTFPFPAMTDSVLRALREIGNRYDGTRSQVMQLNACGLRGVYDRLHDQENAEQVVETLRHIQADMDKTVATAYGWDDLKLGHGFHETKQGLRFTISEAARREVLACLLKLNHERHTEEVARGLHDNQLGTTKVAAKKKAATLPGLAPELSLFAELSYPVTEADKAICAASLAVIEQTADLASMDHVDALLLVTHPSWCKAFLNAKDKRRLDGVVAKAPPALFVGANDSIHWKESRDYLEQRKAIRVDHGSVAQSISATAELSAVKATLPSGVNNVAKLALLAVDSLRKLRQKAATATTEQQQILSVLHKQAVSLGLVAA